MDHTCEVGDKPATRVVSDLKSIPDESFWRIEPEDGPWYFCDEHAGEPARET
jgi:hypothetical protein